MITAPVVFLAPLYTARKSLIVNQLHTSTYRYPLSGIVGPVVVVVERRVALVHREVTLTAVVTVVASVIVRHTP
jgi:hypothetical protein